MPRILAAAGAVAVVLSVRILVGFWKAKTSVGNHPGSRSLFTGFGLISIALQFLPKRIAACLEFLTPPNPKTTQHQAFREANFDVIATISALPSAHVDITLADAAVIKEVTSSRARFPKPVHMYALLSFFGDNIVTSEGDLWKKFRKISAPAFSDRNNKMVWDETATIMTNMFETIWKDKDIVTVDNCTEITLPIAMFVIGVAGFGKKMAWVAEKTLPPGHQMSFQDALHVVSTTVVQKLLLPSWLGRFSAKARRIFLAFDELERYLFEMIDERQSGSVKGSGNDLFSKLLEANNEDDNEAKLSRSDITGNMFIFLLAGHETTAHTLAFTFAFLALFPEEQEILYQQIKSIIPDGRIPSYAEMPLFTQSMAVFYETVRMFPPVMHIPKQSAEDTSLTTTNAAGLSATIPIPKGTHLTISTLGLHYNPRYWPDPYKFKPSRFLEDWPRDAFLPFSAGVRACIGRKFFETEGIIILTMMVSRYKITVKEEPQFAKETFEQRMARVMACTEGITLTPTRVPLVFTRR